MALPSEAEIVRIVRASYEAFSRGDFDAALDWMHPDVEYRPVGGQAPIRGVEAMREWAQPSAFESMSLEARDVTVAGNKVLVHAHTMARGAASGIEMEVDSWNVMTIDDDGLVTRIETFFPYEEAEAREAAGI